MELDIEKIHEGQGVVVAICSENLDAGNVKAFREQIAPILEGHQTVLLDLGKVGFVDSSGLGALLSCLRTMKNRSGQLKLYALGRPVQALFELVRMQRIFSIYNTRDEALASL